MKTVKKCKKNVMHLMLLLMLMLTGCSGYSKFYTQRISENDFAYLESLKEGQTPIILKTNDLRSEYERYLAKNYLMIGESHFNGGMESDDNIINQAINVKATLVIQTSKFITTQGSSTPLITPNGFGGLNATSIYSQQMRYDQSAVFMAKRNKKLRFGIFANDLTPEQRKLFERNTGVVVRVAVEESPVFRANILPGDLIIGIDGISVQGEEHFSKILHSIPDSADKVIFKIIRNSKEKEIEIDLDKS